MTQRALWFIEYEISSFTKTLIVTQAIALGSVAIAFIAQGTNKMINDTLICQAIYYTWKTEDFARCSTLLQGMWLLCMETADFAIVEDIQFLQDICKILK